MRPCAPADTPAGGVPDGDDPLRDGWRSVRRTQPDGTAIVDQVPLGREDLLYPEEDDCVVQEPAHRQDCISCPSTLAALAAAQPDVVVLGDGRVEWGVAGVRPLGSDMVVLFDVRQWVRRATFCLAVEGGRPVLVVEMASPSTRVYDLGIKRALYYQVGVQKYVIVDRGPQGAAPVRLLGYQRGPRGWLPLPPEAQGRLDLAPVGLRVGTAEERPWLYDAVTGAREPDRMASRAG